MTRICLQIEKRIDKFLLSNGFELRLWWQHNLRCTVAMHMVQLGVSELVVGRVHEACTARGDGLDVCSAQL